MTDTSILHDFLVESFEGIDRAERELLELETAKNSDEILQSLFRTIHSIKGAAGFLGFASMEMLAHAGENLLDNLREGTTTVSTEIISTLLELTDTIRRSLQHVERSGHEIRDSHEDLRSRLSIQSALKGHAAAVSLLEPDPLEAAFLQAQQQYTAESSPISTRESVGETTVSVSPDPEQKKYESEPKTTVTESSVRIDVQVLDALMNLVGELVLTRNQINQCTRHYDDQDFLAARQRLNNLASELQTKVMKTRMQPIITAWAKFPKIIRDLSLSLGKEVALRMEGKETELDKTIIEAIKDPLTHIVRNSVDHGLETADVRSAVGKSKVGTITLRAYHEAGSVHVEIRDDGAGLNTERILQKAVEKGLLSAEKAPNLTEKEVHRLIFAPGFSTAEHITTISGRGVGMDVVRTNIENIGGSVDIESISGEGSCIRLKIPLTLAIIPALVVTAGSQRFCIPQNCVQELVLIEESEIGTKIEELAGALFYRLREELLPLLYLKNELKLCAVNQSDSSEKLLRWLTIVVVRVDGFQYGMVVDDVFDVEEIVVKPLSKQISNLKMYSGSTIMGDGRVSLIIDAPSLLKHAWGSQSLYRSNEITMGNQARDLQRGRFRTESLLLVRCGHNSEVAVPLNVVSRLEEINSNSIEYASGTAVVQYRGAIIPVIDLGACFGVPREIHSTDTLQCFVCRSGDQEAAFIVESVRDIVDVEISVESKSPLAFIKSTAVIDGRVTDILDPDRACEMHCAHLFQDRRG